MIESIVGFLSDYGFSAVILCAFLGSALVPIPSEVVIPFGGFLASRGYFSLISLVLASSIANVLGSTLAYFLGSKMKWIEKIGFLKSHLSTSEKLFRKYGTPAVFFGAMLPAVRTYMSIPAGLAKFPLRKFVLLVFTASVVWNTFLSLLGYILGSNWELVHSYGKYFVIAIVILLPIAYFIYRKFEEKISSD